MVCNAWPFTEKNVLALALYSRYMLSNMAATSHTELLNFFFQIY